MNVSIEIGTLVGGKYRIDHELGRGGMGVVYAGTHERLGRSVAIKVLVPEYAHDARAVQRFLVEARAAAQLDHPNVVDVLDVDVDENTGSPYMVLELLKGESLADRLERGVLDWDECWTIMEPVLDALQTAHEAKIVHRDLKPDNIFLSRDGRGRLVPKVLDFGIAKLLQKRNEHSTQSGALLGTPFYMAPEQAIASKAIGPWTDVWALAIVIYECLTGDYPFEFGEGIPFTAVLVQICSDQPRSLRTHSPPVPMHVAIAVDEALTRDHEQRINTARGFANVLGPSGAAAFEDTEVPEPAKIRELFDSLRPESTELDTIWPLNEFALIDEEQTQTDVDARLVDDEHDDEEPTTQKPLHALPPPASQADAKPHPVAAASTVGSTGPAGLPRGTLLAIVFALFFVGLAGVIGGALVASGDEQPARPTGQSQPAGAKTTERETVVRHPSITVERVEQVEAEEAEEAGQPEQGLEREPATVDPAPSMRRRVVEVRMQPVMQRQDSAETQSQTSEPETPAMSSRSGIIIGADEY